MSLWVYADCGTYMIHETHFEGALEGYVYTVAKRWLKLVTVHAGHPELQLKGVQWGAGVARGHRGALQIYSQRGRHPEPQFLTAPCQGFGQHFRNVPHLAEGSGNWKYVKVHSSRHFANLEGHAQASYFLYVL